MLDPYTYHGANLMNSARKMFQILPSDTDQVESVCKAIRIWNPNNTAETVRFLTYSGEDITVWVPANSVWTEPTVITQVFETGTTSQLIIHGYSD